MNKIKYKIVNRLNFSNILTVLFIVVLIWYFFNNQDSLSELKNVPFWAILALTVSKAVRIFASGFFTLYTLRAFGKKISIRETNNLSLLTAIGNFFGPILGGAGIRAVYLKKYHDFNYSSFISTLYAYYLVSFLANSFFGLILMVYLISAQGFVRGTAVISLIFLGIFLACLAMIAIPEKYLRKIILRIKIIPPRLRNISNLVIDGWGVMRTNTRLLVELSLLNLVTFIISAITTYVLFVIFADQFTLVSVLMYTLLSTLALLINFTPGAIGIKEAIFIFSSGLIMLSTDQILQMAIVDRGTTFILLGILFLLSKLFPKKYSFTSGKT